MRKEMIKKAILYSPILLLIIFTISVFSNPLRWSDERIRAYMLKRTPVGTNMEDVINIIEKNKKWKIDTISNNGGYMLQHGSPTFVTPYNIDFGGAIGTQSIRANLGEYRNIFVTDVLVFFGFDENSRLVDLHVRKDIDAL